MEERKVWEALLKDLQRSYDAQCKKILSLKKTLAYLYKECLSEYRDLSLKEIYDRLDTDPTSNKVVSQNVEDLKMPDSKVCYDLLFKLAHPKDPKRRLWIDMEPQGIDPGKDVLYHRGFYYVCRLIDGQRNDPQGFTGDAYADMHKVISFWICLRHPRYKDNKLYRYYVEENRITGKGKTKRRGKDTMEVLILYPRRRYRYDFY